MSAIVDSSVAFEGFEESMMKRPMYTDQHHSEFAFHRFSLLREKNIGTDTVLLSSDEKRCVSTSKPTGNMNFFFPFFWLVIIISSTFSFSIFFFF